MFYMPAIHHIVRICLSIYANSVAI